MNICLQTVQNAKRLVCQLNDTFSHDIDIFFNPPLRAFGDGGILVEAAGDSGSPQEAYHEGVGWDPLEPGNGGEG